MRSDEGFGVAVTEIEFLSSLAQDFIEECAWRTGDAASAAFLSSLAQDFIEESLSLRRKEPNRPIPELSSSGLH